MIPLDNLDLPPLINSGRFPLHTNYINPILRSIERHALRPHLLHHLSVLSLWLAVSDPQLLKEHIARIVHGVGVPLERCGSGPLPLKKSVQAVGSELRISADARGDGAEEGNFGDARFRQEVADFAADFVASVVNRDRGGEGDGGDVEEVGA